MGREGLGLTRQISGKRTTRGLAPSFLIDRARGRLNGQRLGCGLVDFEVFEPQFQLFDVGVQLFGTPAEVHAFQFEDQQLQALDLGLARIEFGLFGQQKRF